MSIEALRWAMKVEAGNGSNKLVLFLLADRYHEMDNVAWPSVNWLAEHTELSRRTVQRALRDLEAAGLIIPVGTRGRSADRQSTAYRLPIDDDPPRKRGVNVTPRCGLGITRHEMQTGRHPVANGASL